MVLKVLEMIWRPNGARGRLVLPQDILEFSCSVYWPSIGEKLLHVNISLKCNLLILQRGILRSMGRKELKMASFGLFPISSLAMYL